MFTKKRSPDSPRPIALVHFAPAFAQPRPPCPFKKRAGRAGRNPTKTKGEHLTRLHAGSLARAKFERKMAAAGGAATPGPEEGGEGESTPPAAPDATTAEALGPVEHGTGDSETG